MRDAVLLPEPSGMEEWKGLMVKWKWLICSALFTHKSRLAMVSIVDGCMPYDKGFLLEFIALSTSSRQ